MWTKIGDFLFSCNSLWRFSLESVQSSVLWRLFSASRAWTLTDYSKKNAEYVCLWKNVTIFANDKTIIHEPEQSTYHSDVCHGAYVPLYICHRDDPSGLSGCIMVFLRDTRLWTQAFLHFYDSIISVYNSSHTDETDFFKGSSCAIN